VLAGVKLTNSCVCPVIDHEFRHNIVKIALDLTKFVFNNRTDTWKADINLFFYNNKAERTKLSENARNSGVCSLSDNEFAIERAKISAIIVKQIFSQFVLLFI